MSFKIIRRDGPFPPGGWIFTDSKTGMKFGEGGFGDVVSAIIRHRRANPRLYPSDDLTSFDYESVATELSAFTCMRLHNDARYCESGEPKPIDTEGMDLMTMSAPCPKCGCKTGYQIICKTCAGKKRTGFYCENCKNLCPR